MTNFVSECAGQPGLVHSHTVDVDPVLLHELPELSEALTGINCLHFYCDPISTNNLHAEGYGVLDLVGAGAELELYLMLMLKLRKVG